MEALCTAIEAKDAPEIMKILKSFKGQEVKLSSLKKPLELAVQLGNEAIVGTIILQTVQATADLAEAIFFQDALTTAIQKDDALNIVKLLVAAGADPFVAGVYDQGIHLATKQDNTAVLEYFLELLSDSRFATASIDIRDRFQRTPLLYAARYGNVKSIQLLMARGADVNALCAGSTILHHASTNGHCPHSRIQFVIQTLVNAGANINCFADSFYLKGVKSTPLMEAASDSQGKSVEALLAVGASLDTEDPETGLKAIHFACAARDSCSMRVLLARGASVSSLDNCGNAPIHVVGVDRYGYAAKAKLMELLNAGADLNLTNKVGVTPLHMACGSQDGRNFQIYRERFVNKDKKMGFLFHLDVFIEAGADLHALSNERNTCMHFLMQELCRIISLHNVDYAVDFILPALEKLKAAGARANIMNIHGFTPLRMLHKMLGADYFESNKAAFAPIIVALLSAGDHSWDLVPVAAFPGLSAVFYDVWNTSPGQLPYLFARISAEEKLFIRSVLCSLHRRVPGEIDIIMRIISYALKN